MADYPRYQENPDYCEHKTLIFALDNKNEWWCQDCRKENPQRRAAIDGNKLGVHLSHCNFGENKCVCKYGDPNCPALTEAWSWVGNRLSDGERAREERDRAYAELRKGMGQFNALEREFFALEDKFLTACRLLNKYGGFPALEELLKYSPAKQREADDREEDDEGSPEKGCGGECGCNRYGGG